VKNGIRTVFQGASWQRCKVHFLRNVTAKVPKSAQGMVLAAVKNIFLQTDKESATAALRKTATMLEAAAVKEVVARALIKRPSVPVLRNWRPSPD